MSHHDEIHCISSACSEESKTMGLCNEALTKRSDWRILNSPLRNKLRQKERGCKDCAATKQDIRHFSFSASLSAVLVLAYDGQTAVCLNACLKCIPYTSIAKRCVLLRTGTEGRANLWWVKGVLILWPKHHSIFEINRQQFKISISINLMCCWPCIVIQCG